jgi:hypothetical protein
MFNRKSKDVLERFETYKLKNRLDTTTAHDAIRCCFRYIKRGISCALIVSDVPSTQTVMSILQGNEYYENLSVVKIKPDGLIFSDDVEFRVFPKNNEPLAHILLGKDAKIIKANDGDPKVKKFNKIMGL